MAVNAYILITVAPGKTSDAAKTISKIKGVKTTHVVTGPYDIITYAEAPNLDNLGNLVVSQIQAVEGVQRSLTCVAVAL
jgi:DNA-binding Lrp family transcriptional regulator